MKRVISLVTLILSSSALAASSSVFNNEKRVYFDSLGCSDCFNFVAPSVFDASTVDPGEIGQIVYDTNDHKFKGYGDDGNWEDLSKSQGAKFLKAKSLNYTPVANNTFLSMNGLNVLHLTPGSWRISGSIRFSNNGSNPGYQYVQGFWAVTNGLDNNNAPVIANVDAGDTSFGNYQRGGSSGDGALDEQMPTIRMTVTENTTVYLVPRVLLNINTTAVLVSTYSYAERVQ